MEHIMPSISLRTCCCCGAQAAGTAIIISVLLFGLTAILDFVAANWRRGELTELHEWGLAGQPLGTIVTWFLLGRDAYTACAFIGAGAIGFFALPYTIIVIRWSFLFCCACGRLGTRTTTSPPPTSSKATRATAGSRLGSALDM
jgi:SSS family solute:Na+ symporter